MIERFAVDTSAVGDLMRVDRETPPPLATEDDLCIQHNLPLLTTDRGFDHIEGLTAMHW